VSYQLPTPPWAAEILSMLRGLPVSFELHAKLQSANDTIARMREQRSHLMASLSAANARISELETIIKHFGPNYRGTSGTDDDKHGGA